MREGILCGNCEKRETCTRQCRREERRRYKINHPDKHKEHKKRDRRNYKVNHRKLPLLLYEWRNWIFANSPKYRKIYSNEYLNELGRKYYANNREKCIASVNAYTKREGYKYNIVTKRAAIARRKHKMRGLEYSLTEEQWNKILQLQGYKCQKCKQQFTVDDPATRDHIIPVNVGGGLTFENTQALCRSCNSRKQDNLDKSNILTWIHTHQQLHLDIVQISAKSILTPEGNEQVWQHHQDQSSATECKVT